MKVVSSLKLLCEFCYIVRRGKKLYLRCTQSPRHKRRQGFGTLNTQVYLTHAMQENEQIRSYDGYYMDMPLALRQGLGEDEHTHEQ